METKLTWLDKALTKYDDLTEEDKIEMYLNSIGIYGYGSEISSAVLAAHGTNKNKILNNL